MVFITDEGLKKLDEYKYRSGGYSKLDNIINPFWERVEKALPRTMAPNMVTFIGFIFEAMSYLCMLYYDATLTKEIPAWTFFFAAFCQFVYQTMDAVDGKHARETKSSSPLGQLFDHGCDSFSINFLFLTTAQACRLHDPSSLIIFIFAGQLNFFASNWNEYHTKILRTHVGNFGVTEGELMIIAVLLVTGIFGQHVWDINAIALMDPKGDLTIKLLKDPLTRWLLNVQLKTVLLTAIELSGIVLVIKFFSETLQVAKNKQEAVLQYIPIAILFLTMWIWKDLEIFQVETGCVMLTGGLIFSLISSKLIVCSLTEMKTPLLSVEATIMLSFGIFMHLVHGTKLHKYDQYIIWGLLAFVTIAIIDWAHECITEITSHLGIYCFSLERRQKKKTN